MMNSHGGKKKKTKMPTPAMIAAGMANDKPQSCVTNRPAITDPRILPADVCAFHSPKINPRLKDNRTTL